MAETAIRGKKKGFTVLYNSVLADTRLSLKTKGLFAIMQSFPDDWNYSVSGLAAKAGVGRDSIRNCLKELREAGYLLQEQTHGEGGKFGAVTFILQDVAPPLTEKPSTAKPSTAEPSSAEPSTENPPQQNKQDIIYNPPIIPPKGDAKPAKKRCVKQQPDWNPERFAKFWEFYRKHGRGENKQGAIRAWDRLQPSDELIDIMARALVRQAKLEQWKRGEGPHASTWLNNARWEDELRLPDEPAQPAGGRRYLGTEIVDGEERDIFA